MISFRQNGQHVCRYNLHRTKRHVDLIVMTFLCFVCVLLFVIKSATRQKGRNVGCVDFVG